MYSPWDVVQLYSTNIMDKPVQSSSFWFVQTEIGNWNQYQTSQYLLYIQKNTSVNIYQSKKRILYMSFPLKQFFFLVMEVLKILMWNENSSRSFLLKLVNVYIFNNNIIFLGHWIPSRRSYCSYQVKKTLFKKKILRKKKEERCK